VSLNEHILNKYKREVFIETGLQDGESVDYALKCNFKDIFSIEVDRHYVSLGLNKYVNNPNVHIIQGDSSVELEKLLISVTASPLIWLDAHPFREDMRLNQCPLLAEIEAVGKHYDRLKPVLMIDDMRVFNEEDKNIIKEKVLAFAPDHVVYLDTRCGIRDIFCIEV